jgi:uncharacterized protein YdeI (YjbR/CyaY-like superfamily)
MKGETFVAKSVEDWREWLAGHYDSVSEVWLVFHKKHSGVTSIPYKDALDEALCIGWVDSLVKRLDDRRYAIKFTPRRPDSRWSDVNRRRWAALKASGRLKPAGLQRAPTARRSAPKPRRLELPSTLPPYVQKALDGHPKAMRHFAALPIEQRRRYFAWIESAKQDETKARRLKEAIRLLTAGQRLGLK